jgi:hypothetical protein
MWARATTGVFVPLMAVMVTIHTTFANSRSHTA